MTHRHILHEELTLAGQGWLVVDLYCKEKKKKCAKTLYLGLLVKHCVITLHTNSQFIWEKEKKMKPEMRENWWRTRINAFIDPVGFISTHWLTIMVWPNGVLDLLCSRVLIITLTSIKPPSREHSSDSIGVAKGSLLRLHVPESQAGFCDSPGQPSDIWLTARLLTNEPTEDVRHHLETVKSLSATSKWCP